ncbi:MAG: TolC family protein [Flavobacteriales bacterium]
MKPMFKSWSILAALMLLLTSSGLMAQTNNEAPSTSTFSLKEAQDYAVKNSFNVKSVRHDAKAAELQTKELTGIGLPQLNGSVQYQNFIDLPTSIVPGEFFGAPGQDIKLQFGVPQQMTAGLSASQLLFDGSWLVGLQASKAYAQLQQQQVQLSERDVRKNVMDAYGYVLIAEEGLQILLQSKTLLENTLKETNSLYKEGFIEEQTVEQLQLNLNDVNNRIANSETQLVLTKNLLKFTMGYPLNADITLTDKSDNLLLSNTEQVLASTYNPESSLEFQLSKSALEMQELNLKNEKAKTLPNLAAFYNLQAQALRREFNFMDTSKPWFPVQLWGVQMNVPIFSGGRRYYSIQRAKVNVLKSSEQLNFTKEATNLQYLQAKTEYQNALGNYNLAKSSVELAERIQSKTLIKFKEGVATSFDLSQSNNQVIIAQGNFVQAMMNLLSAQTKLQKTLNQL